MTMRMLEVCAGIGGAALAAYLADGIEIVGQVECEPFCLAVLEHYWPQVKRVERIQDVRGDEWGPVDICIASIPCQPFSSADKRQGSGDERNLWPEMRRILSAQWQRGEPYKWFLLENVKGLLSCEQGTIFKTIIQDLNNMGYRVGWCCYGAKEAGAPHRRERIFVVAYATNQRDYAQRRQPAQETTIGYDKALADAISPGPETTRNRGTQEAIIRCGEVVADTNTQGFQEWNGATTGSSQPAIVGPGTRSTKSEMGGGASRVPYRMAEYPEGHRWPSGPGQEQEAWEPPRVVTHRLPRRVAQIKALGNAIVPQQLALLLREIVRVEEASA